MMGSSLCWADSSGVADDPSLRTWTNKNTGSTVEARPVALNMKTVKLVTTAKKPITMPLEKLSDEDRAWLEEHKEVIGKPIAEWSSMPSGPVAEEMKGKTYMLENGKLKKRDGKLNPKHFILYFSASWCGPCCRNAPHSVEAYNRVVKDNPDVEVVVVPAVFFSMHTSPAPITGAPSVSVTRPEKRMLWAAAVNCNVQNNKKT